VEAIKSGLSVLDYLKARQYINPQNIISKLIVYRKNTVPYKPHHFFAHIQNLLDPSSYRWWSRVIRDIKDYNG